jgi:hypothetical protein
MGFAQLPPEFSTGQIESYSHPDFEALMKSRPRVRVMRDFVFFLQEMPNDLAGQIVYNPDYIERSVIDALIARFTRQVERIAAA